MVKLIEKAAVVAEIERLIEQDYPCDTFEESTGYYNALDEIATFIDTLEVKREMDLEKELNNWRHNHFHGRRDREANGEYLERVSQLNLAKHFFELGLQVNNSITAADRGTAEEIITNLKRVEEDYQIDLTKEKNWVLNKAQKGE